jgi:hypothetical protein
MAKTMKNTPFSGPIGDWPRVYNISVRGGSKENLGSREQSRTDKWTRPLILTTTGYHYEEDIKW